jgi:hypothetical protein
MSDFLSRLVQRTRGEVATVRPVGHAVTAPDPGAGAWDEQVIVREPPLVRSSRAAAAPTPVIQRVAVAPPILARKATIAAPQASSAAEAAARAADRTGGVEDRHWTSAASPATAAPHRLGERAVEEDEAVAAPPSPSSRDDHGERSRRDEDAHGEIAAPAARSVAPADRLASPAPRARMVEPEEHLLSVSALVAAREDRDPDEPLSATVARAPAAGRAPAPRGAAPSPSSRATAEIAAPIPPASRAEASAAAVAMDGSEPAPSARSAGALALARAALAQPTLARAGAWRADAPTPTRRAVIADDASAVHEHNTTVEVSIGRIEVRLPQPPRPRQAGEPATAPRRAAVSLAEYLRDRDAGKPR